MVQHKGGKSKAGSSPRGISAVWETRKVFAEKSWKENGKCSHEGAWHNLYLLFAHFFCWVSYRKISLQKIMVHVRCHFCCWGLVHSGSIHLSISDISFERKWVCKNNGLRQMPSLLLRPGTIYSFFLVIKSDIPGYDGILGMCQILYSSYSENVFLVQLLLSDISFDGKWVCKNNGLRQMPLLVLRRGWRKKWLPADSHEILHQQTCSMRPTCSNFMMQSFEVLQPILTEKLKHAISLQVYSFSSSNYWGRQLTQ